MRNRLPNLWTLGGLTVPDLLLRTAGAAWHDDVFGQGGRMAFYQFLAIFPTLFLFFTVFTHTPHLGGHLKDTLRDLSTQIFPNQVSTLFQGLLHDFTRRPHLGIRLVSVALAAVWAAHNGTWAMIYGLNRAYEVDEHRSWWKLTLTIVGLTLCLAVIGILATLFLLCSAKLQAYLHSSAVFLRLLEWLILVAALTLSFALLYRLAPNCRDHAWRWSTPGTLCAILLWTVSTFLVRAYFDHVNDYARSYGHLNGVVMLLLWLYFTNGAILIGGEMNSEIQKAEAEHADAAR